MTFYEQELRKIVGERYPDATYAVSYTHLDVYKRQIYADGIEEININSWRDIEVQYSDGRSEKLTEHFDSPEMCIRDRSLRCWTLPVSEE